MTRYVILRHGSNGANQHLTQTMVVGLIEARNRRAAVDAAADQWTCYNNQYFDPIPWSRAPQWQRDAAEEADQLTTPLVPPTEDAQP
jgi:hypothetical protein